MPGLPGQERGGDREPDPLSKTYGKTTATATATERSYASNPRPSHQRRFSLSVLNGHGYGIRQRPNSHSPTTRQRNLGIYF